MIISSPASVGDVRLAGVALGVAMGLVVVILGSMVQAWGQRVLESTRLKQDLFQATLQVRAEVADECEVAGRNGLSQAEEAEASDGTMTGATGRRYRSVAMLPALAGQGEEQR
jgi:hypothetical protein